MFDQITEYVTGSAWTYGVVLGVSGLDAFFIVTARFIPGGRTATTFAAGMLDMSWRRFVVYDAIAVAIEGWRRVKPRR